MDRSRRINALLFLALLLMGATASFGHEQAGGASGFGDHVSEMAPEHPRTHGHLFGACVSGMARGVDCPHLPHHHG